MPEAPSLALYRLPLAEFTAARDQLAKQLKKDGDADAAATVKALRKPPNSAWALNQVAAEQPEIVKAVLEAGTRLREATDRAAIVEATKAERAAREAAADASSRALEAAGLPTGGVVRQQVLDTLHAAMVDEDVASTLRAGTLDKAYASSGFDFAPGGAVATTKRAAPKPKKTSKVDDGAAEAEARAKAEAERLEAERVAEEQRAERAAEAKRASLRADELEQAADEAEARAVEAREAATAARAEADKLTALVD